MTQQMTRSFTVETRNRPRMSLPAKTAGALPLVRTKPPAEPPRKEVNDKPHLIRFPRSDADQWVGKDLIIGLKAGPHVAGKLVAVINGGLWLHLDDALMCSREARRPIGRITISAASVGHAHLDPSKNDLAPKPEAAPEATPTPTTEANQPAESAHE